MLRFGLTIAAIVFVVDQLTKYIVLEVLHFSPIGCREGGYGCRFIELTPFFDLQMVWNRGISFGLLRADNDAVRWALVVMSFAISGVFLWWLRSAEGRRLAAALGLVIGGAIGNVVDRIRFGAVADFLDFNGLWFPWVFNVADAAITLGAVLLGVEMIFFMESAPGEGTPWQQVRAKATAWASRVRGRLGKLFGRSGRPDR